MILVDIGNSGLRTTKFLGHLSSDLANAAWHGPVIKLSWSAIGETLRKAQPKQAASYGERWSQMGDAQALEWVVSHFDAKDAEDWRIASVNRPVFDRLRQSILNRYPSARIAEIRSDDVGIAIDVEQPARVGIDRLLAARAAIHRVRDSGLRPTPIIVVQAGTAITIDWVNERDEFGGGAILPGVGLSLQYLAAGTDKLPWLPTQSIQDYPPLPGKSTDEAIVAGVHAAVVGGAGFLIDRYRSGRSIPVVVSGGDGSLLKKSIAPPAYFVENLVLLGLALSQSE
jgi:type III pantothenate kinase